MQYNNFSFLRGTFSDTKMIEEIVSVGFVTYVEKKSGQNMNFDFSNHSDFNEKAVNLSTYVGDDFSSLLKDIIVCGIIKYCPESNMLYEMLKKHSLEELKQLIVFDLFEPKLFPLKPNEFSSTYEISKLIMRLVDVDNVDSIMDLCSGFGNFLVAAADYNKSAELFGVDIKFKVGLISKIRLSLIGTKNCIREGNIFSWNLDRKYDVVFSNYPWNMRMLKQPEVDADARIEVGEIKLKSDWAFISKAINSFSSKGKAFVLVNNGWLANSMDRDYRQQILNHELLEMVISLPEGTQPGTLVNYSMLVFSEGNKIVKMVDASKCYLNDYRNKVIDVESIMNIITNKGECYKELDVCDLLKEDSCLNVERYFESEIKILNPVALSEVAKTFRGAQLNPKKQVELDSFKGEYSILKLSDIQDDGTIDYQCLKSLDDGEGKLDKFLLKEGDIVFTSRGPSLKMAVIQDLGDRKVIPAASLMVVRANENKINPYYLYLFFDSDVGRLSIKRLQTGGSILVISKSSLDTLDVPLIDLELQEVAANRYKIFYEKIKRTKEELNLLECKVKNIYLDIVGD